MDLKLSGFKKTWDLQEKIFTQLIKKKSRGEKINEADNKKILSHLLICEHPHVYTLGKSGSKENLLLTSDQLDKKNAEFFRINRGGDITYHGPGQIVGYPIFDLEVFQMNIKEYINKIEEVIINTLKEYNIMGEHLNSATGVWIDTRDNKRTRKICAIGVRASKYVTMHGFALNVNTDLEYFSYINPCGFIDKGVTSMEKELGKKININEVKEKLKYHMAGVFNLRFV